MELQTFVAIIVKFVRKNSVNDNIIIVYGKKLKTATLSVDNVKRIAENEICIERSCSKK